MKNTVGLSLPEHSYNTRHTVLIVGAGLAGCAIAHALAKHGYRCRVFDQYPSVATTASALPAAVVRPAISGDALFKQYFDHAFALCCKAIDPSLFTQCGSLELTDQAINSNSWHGQVTATPVSAMEASTLAATQISSDAIYIKDAGYIAPAELCNHWLQHSAIEFVPSTAIQQLRKTEHGWQLLSDTHAVIDESHVVVLATAADTTAFDVAAHLPLPAAAGQIDLFDYADSPLKCIVNGDGYLLPQSQGVWCGSTHRRDQLSTSISATDSTANHTRLHGIAPSLNTASAPAASFCAMRTFTPDRLPMVGALHDHPQYVTDYADLKHGKPAHHFPPPAFHDGVFLATGLGSRGATQALLIGELISELISGKAIQTEQSHSIDRAIEHKPFLEALHPARFLVRALRRGHTLG